MLVKTTVVVVTFNSRRNFGRLRHCLEQQTTPFRLVIWDNASEASERPHCGDFFTSALLIQSEENVGFAVANNRAISLTDTPFVALLNPDAFPEPTWLEELLKAVEEHPEVAAVGSLQIMADDEGRYDGYGDCYFAAGAAWRGGHGAVRKGRPIEGEVFGVCAAAALYRSDVWRSIGGFDERYFAYNEDVDLSFRIRLSGWRILQTPLAVVRHVGGASAAPTSDFATFYVARNRIWTFVKDMPASLFWLLLPAHIALSGYQLLSAWIRGVGTPTWRGMMAALRGLHDVWSSRREIQRARVASTTDIAAALSWSPIRMMRREIVVRPMQKLYGLPK